MTTAEQQLSPVDGRREWRRNLWKGAFGLSLTAPSRNISSLEDSLSSNAEPKDKILIFFSNSKSAELRLSSFFGLGQY